jgi:hypothetical protein
MASEQDENQEADAQARQLRQRTSLNNAYASIAGRQSVGTFLSFTFEEAMDLQIERIEGESTQLRPNLLDRVDRIEQEVISTVDQLKNVPDEAFQEADEDEDVNTV